MQEARRGPPSSADACRSVIQTDLASRFDRLHPAIYGDAYRIPRLAPSTPIA